MCIPILRNGTNQETRERMGNFRADKGSGNQGCRNEGIPNALIQGNFVV